MSRKGSPNKNKEFLTNRLKDMYGDDFDPIMKAAANAVRMDELAQEAQDSKEPDEKALEFDRRKDCSQAWDRIAQYTTPKLKAIEIEGSLKLNKHEEFLDQLED